ncbi:MAG: YkgJ family cysteine cluster protein [Candidatus Micrarchaeia archaeon]
MPFACNCCAKCCMHLRQPAGTTGAPQKGPVFFLAKPAERGPTLFEWEKERLEAKAAELGLSAQILPLQVVFDASVEGGRVVAALWHLAMTSCPFLNDKNLCGVYENRPLACRAFPLFGSRVSWNRFKIKPFASALCPKAIEVKAGGREEFFHALAEAYGECYAAAEKMDLALAFKDIMLHRLLSTPSLKFERGPLESLRARFSSSPVVGALSLARSLGLLQEGELAASLRLIRGDEKP